MRSVGQPEGSPVSMPEAFRLDARERAWRFQIRRWLSGGPPPNAVLAGITPETLDGLVAAGMIGPVSRHWLERNAALLAAGRPAEPPPLGDLIDHEDAGPGPAPAANRRRA